MSTSILTISSIIDFVKIMLDLRLINIIENRERKQKTRTCERKQER